MSSEKREILMHRFLITDEQLEELVYDVNEAFACKRRKISRSRNIDPFESLPIIQEKLHLLVPGINSRNGSIYIHNIEVAKDIICLEINAAMSAIVSALKEADQIKERSKKLEDERARKGLTRLKTFDGPLTTVEWGDQFVASALVDAYRAITGLSPTMGGYKKPKTDAGDLLIPAREIRSPFTVFAFKLIEMAQIKRLGAGDFSIGVIRKALSSRWSEEDYGDNILARPALLKLAAALAPKPPGRPAAGKERWRVEASEAIEPEDFTTAELLAFAMEAFPDDD